MDNPNDSKDVWEADNESEMELDNNSEDAEPPKQGNVIAAPNVPKLIWPIQWSKKKAEKALITLDIMEKRRNTGIKKK